LIPSHSLATGPLAPSATSLLQLLLRKQLPRPIASGSRPSSAPSRRYRLALDRPRGHSPTSIPMAGSGSEGALRRGGVGRQPTRPRTPSPAATARTVAPWASSAVPRRQQLSVCAYARPSNQPGLPTRNPIEAADLPLHACPGKGAAVLHRQQRYTGGPKASSNRASPGGGECVSLQAWRPLGSRSGLQFRLLRLAYGSSPPRSSSGDHLRPAWVRVPVLSNRTVLQAGKAISIASPTANRGERAARPAPTVMRWRARPKAQGQPPTSNGKSPV